MKLKDACFLEGKLWQTWQHIKKQRHYFANKGPHSQSHPVVMYGCESWTIKKAEHQRSYAFELWRLRGLLRVPWTERRSNQSILKKSILNIHWKDWCWNWDSNTLATWCEELTHWKRRWCWKDWRQGEKGMTEDEMVGWHHRLDGHEFEQAPGVDDRQRNLVGCSPWDHKESDMTERLNWKTDLPQEW